MKYEVHYKTDASTTPNWQLTNLGLFADPIEADAAAHSWQAGYEKARGGIIEIRVETAGWFDRMANAAPDMLAALVECLESGTLAPLTPNTISRVRAAILKATPPTNTTP